VSELADLLRTALSGGSLVALPLVVVGGVVTGLNPCCLPLSPAAAATCCAARGDRLERAFWTALAFVGGLLSQPRYWASSPPSPERRWSVLVAGLATS
jgi:cytochrome c biogenesis protein CcdA